jgi:hypothetical protein
MRLTLRTLLAYLDDILDPADKDELAQKIESSDFAEDLVHRTRDTVRRLRLSAPQLIGTGMGLDPNSVAEYLDNVLPPDAVGDYERICLESDVHLAEAAACHHVLTMVLGEPADVDPLARQRMYSIATEAAERKRVRVEPPHVVRAASPSPIAASAPATVPAAHQTTAATMEIPDYLRTGAWWRSRVALVAIAALLIIGIAIFWFGLRGWFGGGPSVAAESRGTPDTVSSENLVQPIPPSESATEAPAETLAAPSGLGAPPQPLTPGITAPAATPAAVPDKYAPVAAEASSPPANSASVLNEGTAAQVPPLDAAAAPPVEAPVPGSLPHANDAAQTFSTAANDVPPPADAAATANVAAADEAIDASAAPVESVPAAPATSVVETSNGAPPTEAPLEPGAPIEAKADVPAGPTELGTYMGGETVLLRHDDNSGTWLRVEPRAAVIAGERLLALPEFRPKVALLSGLHLDISGGTQIIVGADTAAAAEPAGGSDIPIVEVIYGRVILINPTKSENPVRVRIGPTEATARLGHNATLAIEVERKYVVGQDPQKVPAPVEARAFAPEGGVVWQDAGGELQIDKASRWNIGPNGASDVAADTAPPEWIDQEPIVQLSEQRYGAPVIESTLVSNRPADVQLLELFHGKDRREVKSLVARSSIHVGLFEPFIDALRDSDQKANWKTQIETLRAAMALGPDSAASVKRALVEQRGKQAADDLYAMLCGYNADQVGRTAEQMKAGAVPQLIDWLEQDSLDYRVLASHDLWEITGKRLMPNPAASVAERNQNIRRWRTRLEEGELVPPTQP